MSTLMIRRLGKALAVIGLVGVVLVIAGSLGLASARTTELADLRPSVHPLTQVPQDVPRSASMSAAQAAEPPRLPDNRTLSTVNGLFYGEGRVADYPLLGRPTSVRLLSFTATGTKQSVVVNWETASETDNLGFDLFRAEQVDGEKTKVNSGLIPSLVRPGSPLGARYEYVDLAVMEGLFYFYWLDMVDIFGGRDRYGPVSARVGPPLEHRVFLPLVTREQSHKASWPPAD